MSNAIGNQTASIKPTPEAAPLLLPNRERHKMVIEWNLTEQDYPKDKCVHQLFEEQAERTPDTVAVVFEEQSLTYRELNARANQLAHNLRSLGVGPDVLVGLCVERCVEMVVALVGILKAGGAYVPLDPRLPRERLAFLLRDIGAQLVLVQRQWRDRLPVPPDEFFSGPRTLLLEELLASSPRTGQSNSPCVNTPDHLAYLMYTSGTSGQPKGVMVPHLGIVRLVINPNYVALTPQDILLQFAPLAFDASTFEIWGSLLNGARLVVYPAHAADYSELGRVITAHGVTTLWLTAALFHEMVEHAPKALAGVRQLLTGGDVLSPVKVRAYLELPGHGRLINGYGPTENTTFTCCGAFDRAEQIGAFVPLGQPIAGTQVWILDTQSRPVPLGVVGEIYAGGDGLARGYLNAPELTAERFLPDPFNPDPRARLYKTGDLARWLPDGNIEFLGRMDSQVKIRGFRVELGEIEAVLGGHPGLTACAVVTQYHRGGDKTLAAFVVGRDPATLSVGSLRRWLAEKLPDYMVPARFTLLASLPLTANGKLDRKALETLPGVTQPPDTSHLPSRTDLEFKLVEIWQEVLRQDRVGIQDDFFALGGHSLLTVSMLNRVYHATGVMPALSRFFSNPRIQNLSTIIEEERVRLSMNAPGSPGVDEAETPLFLLGFLLNLESAELGNRRYYVIPFPDFGSSIEQCKVEFLAEKCLEKLRAIQPHGPYILAGYSLAGLVAYEMACRLWAEGEDVPLVAIIDTKPSTHLQRMAPALVAPLGSKLGLSFHLQLALARGWFHVLERSRCFRHFPGAHWRRGCQAIANDLARFKNIWRLKRTQLAPGVAEHVLPPGNDLGRSLFKLGGFGSYWPHIWAHCAYQPKPYAGFVAVFLTKETALEPPAAGRGWEILANRLQEYSLPGDHSTCVSQYKNVLVQKLLTCLASVENNVQKGEACERLRRGC